MKTINVKKEILLERIKKNRDEHSALIRKAQEGYRARAIVEFEYQLARAKAGKRFTCNIRLTEPEDHTDDYDRLIEILELSSDDLIGLSEEEFDQYVRDRWHWNDEFRNSVSTYLN